MNNDPIEFDDMARQFVKRVVDEMDKMCLKEREQTWEIIAGFVNEHLSWLERLKNVKG